MQTSVIIFAEICYVPGTFKYPLSYSSIIMLAVRKQQNLYSTKCNSNYISQVLTYISFP